MATELLSTYEATQLASPGTSVAKQPELLNAQVVLPLHDTVITVLNVYVYKSPRVRVQKATGEAWVNFDALYWDDTAKQYTKTSTGNTAAGFAVEVAATADTEGEINFNGVLP